MASDEKSCCCTPMVLQIGTVTASSSRPSLVKHLAGLASGLLAWLMVYLQLPVLAAWATYDLLGLPHGTAFTQAVAFFVYDAPKVLFGWRVAAIYFMIPVVQALLEKGAALGTVLAFMMAVIGLSFPEMVILRKVLKPRLIATFAGVVGFGILIVGYLFNMLSIHTMVAVSVLR